MTTPKIRIGFVGVGNMGQAAHLRNYTSIDECEVVAIAELRGQTAQQVAQRYNIPHVYLDHNEMLEKVQLDGIVCPQLFWRHGVIVPEVLRAGVPVLTEKPLAASIEVGERIVQAAKDNQTWHMVGYHKRSDPATMHAKREINALKASGELGRLRYLRITMPPGDWIAAGFNEIINAGDPTPDLAFDPLPSDMDKPAHDDYVRFVNYYIHQVNLMRHLLGEPYHITFVDKSDVLMVGESAGGVTCALEMAPYHTTIDWQETALAAFDKGYVKLTLPAPVALNRPGQVEIFKDPGNGAMPQTIVPQLPWVHAMRQQAIHFIRAIKGEMPAMCDSVEALEDLRVARQYLKLKRGV